MGTKKKEEDDIDCQYTDTVICPYCGYDNGDDEMRRQPMGTKKIQEWWYCNSWWGILAILIIIAGMLVYICCKYGDCDNNGFATGLATGLAMGGR